MGRNNLGRSFFGVAVWMLIFFLHFPCVAKRTLDLFPTELRLGDPCKSSFDCLYFLHHSQCDWTKMVCTCQPYHFQFNDTWCLLPSLLGYPCAVDAQCQMKVKNSECSKDEICQCKENFLPFRKDTCLPPAKVDGYCLNDRQCMMASTSAIGLYHQFSYCEYIFPWVFGKCQCPLGFMISEDGQCFPYLGRFCRTNDDCSMTPNSLCQKQGKSFNCQCVAGFKTSSNKMTCEADQDLKANSAISSTPIKPVSLGKPCLHSSQCKARDPHSECVEGKCECARKLPTCSSSHTQCPNDTFQCTNGQCISSLFVCDGKPNCLDGTDEESCVIFHCPKESFQCNDGKCLPRSAICNKRWECYDGSDELSCYKGIPCDRNTFRCKNGQCLPMYALCNNLKECLDGSDEDFSVCIRGESCPANSFRCNNNRCQSTGILCNGFDECGDNSDEDRCEVCLCDKP